MTKRTPCIARAIEASSRRSPSAMSNLRAARLARGLVARTNARTSWPTCRACLATAAPTKPLAPVTRTFPYAPRSGKEITNERGHAFGLFEMRQVAGALDHRDARFG